MKTLSAHPDIAYKVFTYDLWGNKKDGWEVNDVYPHSTITIPYEILHGSDKEIIRYLRKNAVLALVGIKGWAINGDSNHMCFTYADKPSFEIRKAD